MSRIAVIALATVAAVGMGVAPVSAAPASPAPASAAPFAGAALTHGSDNAATGGLLVTGTSSVAEARSGRGGGSGLMRRGFRMAKTQGAIQAPAAPTLTFTADPTTVNSGRSSTLTWSTTNAYRCMASDGWTGGRATAATRKTKALTETTTFTLTCTGGGGSVTRSVTVTVRGGGGGGGGAVSFERSVVDASSPNNPWMKTMADLNGDRKADLIVSGENGPVVWYQAPTWTRRTISTSAYSESGSATGDINGDGAIDVVVGQTWFENAGNGTSWTARRLPSRPVGTHDIAVGDVNKDGRADIAMRGEAASVVTVFLQTTGGGWTAFDVQPGTGLNGLALADLDGDSFLDVVIGGVWMRNPGAALTTATWTKHTFATWNAYASVTIADLDADGRSDVVLSPSENTGKVSWFKRPADPRAGTWTETVVANGIDSSHSIVVADLNADRKLDIVASEYRGANRAIAYLNAGTSWTAKQFAQDGLHNLAGGDVDADGDTDLFGAGAFGVNPVVLYRNTTGATTGNRVLVFSRTLGFRHASIPDGVTALTKLGAANGFAVDATEDSTVFTAANLARYKAVIFLSPSGNVLTAAQRTAFQGYIRAGGGFVGIHNSNGLTLEGWDWYTKLIGARYKSEITTQPSRLQVVDQTHLSTSGLPNPWTRAFESYNWDVNPKTNGVTVLINLDETSVSGGTMGADHPFSWYHAYDGGRSWYTVGGADSAEFTDQNFLKHLLGGIRYAGGF